MVAVITRVKSASVRVNQDYAADIGEGLLVLLGVVNGDTVKEADYLAGKITGLRIFSDEAGKMGLSLANIGGQMAIVPNFTLAADCRKGRRPDFTAAAAPEEANRLYELFIIKCREILGGPTEKVQTGVFGGDMAVVSHNDGPVTIIMDTKTMFK